MARQLGFLNVYKPAGMSSHDVVGSVRRLIEVQQVGHGGTLDPLAQGVLPIAFGKACRLFRFISSEKIYRAEVLIGIQTTTDDMEGAIIARSDELPGEKEIRLALKQLTGELKQAPPLYSAVHYGGKRLYQLARKGILPKDVPERQVTINSIDLLSLKDNLLDLRIDCSQGTYVRAIARDLGMKLNCGGCLKSLIRERAGPFELKESCSIQLLSELLHSGRLDEAVLNPLDVLANGIHFSIEREDMKRLTMGQSLPVSLQSCEELPIFVSCLNELVAVCRLKDNNELQPEVVVARANTIS